MASRWTLQQHVPQLRTYLRATASALVGTSPRTLARRPLERMAERLIAEQAPVDLSSLTGEVSFQARLGTGRHAWSLHASDQFVLQSLIAARNVRRVFEIGTFNGGTTRVIAESLPADGQIFTLDLPPDHFDRTQAPDNFSGTQVGCEYRSSPAPDKVVQLLEDSLTFDVSPYRRSSDLVFVDGAHDYGHGLSDTRTAFDLLAPGGLIIWDDFQPYWHGLVRGIYEAAGDRRPRRLAGSNLGVWAGTDQSGPVEWSTAIRRVVRC